MTPALLPLAAALLSITCLLGFGCVGGRLLYRRLDAATRIQRTALVGAFAALVLFAIIATVPAPRRPVLPALRQAAPLLMPTDVPPQPYRTDLRSAPPAPAVPAGAAPIAPALDSAAPVPSRVLPEPSRLLLAAWFIGTAASLAYLLHGHLTLVRLRRASTPVTDDALRAEAEDTAQLAQVPMPDLRLHPTGGGPLLAGVFRPTLYLPATLPADSTLRQMLVTHEMTHLHRADVPFLLLSRILCAALWWHPLAHLLARQMEQTAEEVCDLRAATVHDVNRAPEYANFLLQLAKGTRTRRYAVAHVTTGVCTPRSHIGRRITRLLTVAGDNTRAPRRLRVGAGIAAASLIGLGGVVQSSLSAPAAPSKRGDVPTVAQFEAALASSPNNWGPTDALVQVIEFSDFECPACRKANNLVPRLQSPWRGERRGLWVQFRHLPLEKLHPLAMRAAVVAERYAAHGKFWEAHDNLFWGPTLDNRLALMEEQAKTKPAAAPEAEKKQFIQAVQEANRVRQRIYADRALARAWNVAEVPTYFVRDRSDNSIRKCVGYIALRDYLITRGGKTDTTASQLRALQQQAQPIRINARNEPLTRVLNIVLGQVGMTYRIEPGLDLSSVRITTRIEALHWGEAVRKIKEASPVAFDFRSLQGDSKTLVLAPLPPHGALTGRLVYPDGRPAAGYQVDAQIWSQDIFLRQNRETRPNPDADILGGDAAITDRTGKFILRRLGNFRYNIAAARTDANGNPGRQEWVTAAIEGVRPRINQTRNIGTLRLTRGAIVQGRVTNQYGKPLAGFYVGSHGPRRPETSGMVVSTETDRNGYYSLRLPPGKSLVYIGMQHFQQEFVRFTLRDGETKTINLVAKPER